MFFSEQSLLALAHRKLIGSGSKKSLGPIENAAYEAKIDRRDFRFDSVLSYCFEKHNWHMTPEPSN